MVVGKTSLMADGQLLLTKAEPVGQQS
jgi:hypothetical protein